MLKAYFNKNVIEAGLDEAGRGCLAGPVVAAAVILPKGYKNKWLNDSKQLSKIDRDELRLEIETKALVFAVAQASHQEIDKLNILQASILAMHRAVAIISEKICPEHLLIDGNKFIPYPMIPHTCVVNGDGKYLNIAAASILAKTHRDDLMQKLSVDFPIYNWERNLGYPTLFHRKAVLEHGFSPYHRLTFKVKVKDNEMERIENFED
jgi:ribonuclease HII